MNTSDRRGPDVVLDAPEDDPAPPGTWFAEVVEALIGDALMHFVAEAARDENPSVERACLEAIARLHGFRPSLGLRLGGPVQRGFSRSPAEASVVTAAASTESEVANEILDLILTQSESEQIRLLRPLGSASPFLSGAVLLTLVGPEMPEDIEALRIELIGGAGDPEAWATAFDGSVEAGSQLGPFEGLTGKLRETIARASGLASADVEDIDDFVTTWKSNESRFEALLIDGMQLADRAIDAAVADALSTDAPSPVGGTPQTPSPSSELGFFNLPTAGPEVRVGSESSAEQTGFFGLPKADGPVARPGFFGVPRQTGEPKGEPRSEENEEPADADAPLAEARSANPVTGGPWWRDVPGIGERLGGRLTKAGVSSVSEFLRRTTGELRSELSTQAEITENKLSSLRNKLTPSDPN